MTRAMFEHLSAAHTQATRLLRLTTALGADALLAESVRAEEAISTPFTLIISPLSHDASLPLRSLVGQTALLELLTAGAGPLLAAAKRWSSPGYRNRRIPAEAFRDGKHLRRS